MPAGRPKALDLDIAMPTIVRLFWAGGYSRLTLDQVASELGVTKPTLYRALGEKEAVFTAAIKTYHQTYIQPCVEHWEHAATLHEALESGFTVLLDRILDEDLPQGCFMGDTAAETLAEGPIATTIDGLQQQMASTLHERVTRAIDDGELEPAASAMAITQFVLGQFSALSAISRSNPTRAHLESIVGYMLAGLPWASTD